MKQRFLLVDTVYLIIFEGLVQLSESMTFVIFYQILQSCPIRGPFHVVELEDYSFLHTVPENSSRVKNGDLLHGIVWWNW